MSEPIDLTDWEFHLGGCLWGRLADSEGVRTSHIVARNPEENLVQTASGTIYRLGQHGGQSYSPEIMWNDAGWAVGEKKPIPRIYNLSP